MDMDSFGGDRFRGGATQHVVRMVFQDDQDAGLQRRLFFIVLPALPLLWGRKGVIMGAAGAGVAVFCLMAR